MTKEERAKLVTLAATYHLPIGQFLDVARWLLKKDCPYCQLGTQVLRKVQQLGSAKTQHLVMRILQAKAVNDLDALSKIKEEVS